MAEMICRYCDKSIGYEQRYYAVGVPGETLMLVHGNCHEEAVDRELEARR
jgi:hypothetical protein